MFWVHLSVTAFINVDDSFLHLVYWLYMLWFMYCIVADFKLLAMLNICMLYDVMQTDCASAVCVYICIEKATSKLLLDPDWESTLQICDNIRQGDVQ